MQAGLSSFAQMRSGPATQRCRPRARVRHRLVLMATRLAERPAADSSSYIAGGALRGSSDSVGQSIPGMPDVADLQSAARTPAFNYDPNRASVPVLSRNS